MPSLHGLRGLAACGVVLFHGNYHFPAISAALRNNPVTSAIGLPALFERGWVGVPLFFVLAGFLLGGQLRHGNLTGARLTRFWTRRALRIYPAVWLQLPILALLGALLPGWPQLSSVADALRQATLWIRLPPTITPPLNGVWWTLPIELGFYLFLPLIVLLARRLGWAGMFLCALVLTVAWRISAISGANGAALRARLYVLDALPGTLTLFCAGVAAAWLPAPGGTRRRFAAIGLALVALAAVLGLIQGNLDAYWAGNWRLVLLPSVIGVLLASLVRQLATPLAGFGWLASRPMVALGEVSYGLYLWHFQAQMLALAWLSPGGRGPLPSVIAFVAASGLALVCAWLSYNLVERPAQRWGRRVSASPPPAPPAPLAGAT